MVSLCYSWNPKLLGTTSDVVSLEGTVVVGKLPNSSHHSQSRFSKQPVGNWQVLQD
jgi:hypothetical protein